MTKLNKSVLKSGYYYEVKSWYNACPETLPKVKYQTEIFTRYITHAEILKEYNITPYNSYNEAAAVVASLVEDLKPNDWRIVYFKEDEVLYRFHAFRDDDSQLNFSVYEVDLGSLFGPGHGVCFGYPSDTSASLSPSETFTLDWAMEIVKENGYKIIKEF